MKRWAYAIIDRKDPKWGILGYHLTVRDARTQMQGHGKTYVTHRIERQLITLEEWKAESQSGNMDVWAQCPEEHTVKRFWFCTIDGEPAGVYTSEARAHLAHLLLTDELVSWSIQRLTLMELQDAGATAALWDEATE